MQLGPWAPMEKDKIAGLLEDNWPDHEFLLADGFEDAFIGVIYGGKIRHPVTCYDRVQCISILEDQGMTHEEAEEYFSFNMENVWVGVKTPMILIKYTDK